MTLPLWLRDTIRLRTDGECWYCGTRIDATWCHIDHLHPVIQHGTDDIANLVPTCPPCNVSKNGQTVEEYRATIERKQSNIPYFSWAQRQWLESHGFIVNDHRTKGHRFHFEIHNLEERPLPTPDQAGWLVVDLDEEDYDTITLLIRKSKLTKSAYLGDFIRREAKKAKIRYDPDHPVHQRAKPGRKTNE